MKISEKVYNLIIEANCLEASDIHFQPSENGTKIYYRIVEKLIFQQEIPNEEYEKILRFIKFKSRLDISITRTPQDGAFYIENEKKLFVRVSTIPLLYSESLVIRILLDQKVQTFHEIAYEEQSLLNMYEVINKENGLFIFTGPTGSGKTTTMYNILNYLVEQENKKILTIENPIEVINENFVQMQINEEASLTYSKCLKAALRQDPDIIMIGEIRDEETARNVFRAALTGHTVISTMHTKNLYGVIERFLDFGFLKSEIESILIGISNQRLIINPKGEIKSFYDYIIDGNLKLMIKGEILDEGIEKKINYIREQGILSKKV